MIHKLYRSAFMPCPQNGAAFAADAIISNPPAFAHIHTAEALGIPLIMSFSKYQGRPGNLSFSILYYLANSSVFQSV